MTGGNTLPEVHVPGDVQNRAVGYDDDAGYVARCQQGDTEAFAVLVKRRQKQMINIAYRMIGDYDDSCDIVQDAFLAAFRAIGKFRGDARFSTWLCGIVLNRVKTHLAQRAIRLRREGVSFDDSMKSENRGLLNGLCSSEESVVERIEQQERDAKVQECISRLEDEQREVLVLRDMQELSYEDIVVVLKLPEGTVKSRLFRARNALKDCLQRVFGELK
jgi:RNA polymerase sigma-70 factor, ECF subfamily